MTYSLEQVHAGLKLLYQNKRYFSTKTLSAQSGIAADLLDTLINTLPTISLANIERTPGGKFVSFRMTYAAKGFVFVLPNRVWYDGHLVESSGNELFNQGMRAYHNRYYADKAARDGIRNIGFLNLESVAKVVFDVLNPNHASDLAKAELEESLKHLHDYPDALAKVRELMAQEAKLLADIEQLKQADAAASAQYNREYQKAECGQRTKQEAYSVVVGQEDVFVGMVMHRGDAWHGTDDHREPQFERMNKYETRYRTVRDYPTRPNLQQDVIDKLQRELEQNRNQQSTIKRQPVSFQKAATERLRLERLAEEYRRKRYELDAHYKNQGLDLQALCNKRVVFA